MGFGGNVKYIAKNRTLLRALLFMLANGFNNSSMELLRESIRAKKINKYRRLVRKLSKNIEPNDFSPEKQEHKVIWVCWFQGMENAPELVKNCYDSLLQLDDVDVVVVDSNNYADFVTFPDFIIKKWKKGIISNTHFSDLLRLELLYKHGGIWLDSTVLASTPELPSFIKSSWLFFYQLLKPGLAEHSIICSSWAISAVADNPVLSLTREVLHHYWERKNKLEDYFLFHIVLTSVIKEHPQWWQAIPKADNSAPHLLLYEMQNCYEQDRLEQVKELSALHKLTYKYKGVAEGSFLSRFLQNRTL